MESAGDARRERCDQLQCRLAHSLCGWSKAAIGACRDDWRMAWLCLQDASLKMQKVKIQFLIQLLRLLDNIFRYHVEDLLQDMQACRLEPDVVTFGVLSDLKARDERTLKAYQLNCFICLITHIYIYYRNDIYICKFLILSLLIDALRPSQWGL